MNGIKCPKLLVSVQNAEEARVVASSSVDILDIKNPQRGALGRPDPELVREIADICGKRKLSVALGEVVEPNFDPSEFFRSCGDERRLQFGKFGLAELAEDKDWQSKVAEYVTDFPPDIAPVVCAYADSQEANSPSIFEVMKFAIHAKQKLVLVDTFRKTNGSLFDIVNNSELEKLCHMSRQSGIALAIAGSIRAETLGVALSFLPQVIAVRGAACQSQFRGNVINPQSLKYFLDNYQQSSRDMNKLATH